LTGLVAYFVQAYPPSDEILSRTFEAVVGALEQSSGRERAEKFVVDFVGSHLCGKDINDFWDIPKPWHMLLDMNNQTGGGPLEARLLREAGKNTLLSAFVVGIYDVNKKLVGTGSIKVKGLLLSPSPYIIEGKLIEFLFLVQVWARLWILLRKWLLVTF
jgi:dsRNA-specific ribonuclease